MQPPRGQELSGLNLNLLRYLDALLAEASVSKAASRLGVTQSAMSHALRQLREVLGDELLVRGHNGMALTPRPQVLVGPLRRSLVELQRVLSLESGFQPATASRHFTLATVDYFALTLLPSLVELLEREAPGVDIHVRPFDHRRAAVLLESGEVDLVIGAYPEAAPGLRQHKLFTESFACLVRRDHPQVKHQLSLEQYLRLNHALISPRGEGVSVVDAALAQLGHSRRIMLRLPYFVIAPPIIARSDMVLTAPRRLIERFAQVYPLQVLDPPVELPPFSVFQLWHERFDGDPAHQWLRDTAARAARR
jgi:DNA-binding transcriptional LysR family regulator